MAGRDCFSGASAHHAVDTGLVSWTPNLLLCHGGHFVAIRLLEPGDQLSPLQEAAHELIADAGGIVLVWRSVEEVAAILSAIGVRLYSALDHRAASAALHIRGDQHMAHFGSPTSWSASLAAALPRTGSSADTCRTALKIELTLGMPAGKPAEAAAVAAGESCGFPLPVAAPPGADCCATARNRRVKFRSLPDPCREADRAVHRASRPGNMRTHAARLMMRGCGAGITVPRGQNLAKNAGTTRNYHLRRSFQRLSEPAMAKPARPPPTKVVSVQRAPRPQGEQPDRQDVIKELGP